MSPFATNSSRHLRRCTKGLFVLAFGLFGAGFAIAGAEASLPAASGQNVASPEGLLHLPSPSPTLISGSEANRDADSEVGNAEVESRIGSVVGLVRKNADGGLEFTLQLAGAAFAKGARQIQVRVEAACVLTTVRYGENGEESESLTIDRALSALNGTPQMVSIEGTYQRATQTFVALKSLTIVE